MNVVGGVPQKVLTHPATAMAQGKKEAPVCMYKYIVELKSSGQGAFSQ